MPFIEFVKSLRQRFDYNANVLTVCEWILILSIYPLIRFADPKWFMEYGIVENMQLLALLIGAIIAFTSKNEHKLFVVVGFFMLFLITRETNMGRSYFCEQYLPADEVCKWGKFKYGYLVDMFRAIYILALCIYFIKNKLWQPVIKYLNMAPFYVWDITALLLTAFIGSISEFKSIDNEILEETCEFICYVAMLNCIIRYSQWQSNKKIKY